MSTYRDVLTAMESSGADYVWIGLSAASVHGATLASYDFDFFVRPEVPHLDRVRQSLGKAGFVDSMASVHSANVIATGSSLSFSDPYGGPVVDVLVEISGPSFEDVWRDSVVREFQGLRVRIASLRHIVASKLAADRPKDREAIQRLRLDFPAVVEELEKERNQ
jgi:hypothetical protein